MIQYLPIAVATRTPADATQPEPAASTEAAPAEKEPLQADATYFYSLERGPVDADEGSPAPDSPELTGKALLDMERDDYADAATLQQARALMRYVVNHYLGGKPLHTRQLLREMQQL